MRSPRRRRGTTGNSGTGSALPVAGDWSPSSAAGQVDAPARPNSGHAGDRSYEERRRKVRKPHVSFIRLGRLPDERIPAGHVLIPPDLAVEVVSPNDTVYEVDTKVEEYLAAGVPLIWVVNPETRVVHVSRVDGSVERLGERDYLTAADLIPDLRCRVGDLFSHPAPASDLAERA